jgi:hypothetical protein
MKSIKHIFSALALSIVLYSFAPTTNDAKTDFQKMGDAYKNAGSLSVDISYALFPDHETTKPQEVRTGNAIVSKGLYYNHFSDIEILQQNQIAVVADNARKFLILKKVDKQKKNSTVPVDLDSAFKVYKNISYQENSERQGQYGLEFKSGKIEKIDIAFSKETYLIEKLAIFYKEPLQESGQSKTPPRVEIKYNNHLLPAKNGAGVSVKKFFNVVKGKYIPKGIYKNYEFINNLSR